jgi:hypothetical protein
MPVPKTLKSDGLHCASCSALVREDAKFCPQCGKRFDKSFISNLQSRHSAGSGHAVESTPPAGLTPAGWKKLQPILDAKEVALVQDRNNQVIPSLLLAYRLAQSGISGVWTSVEEVGLVLSPTQRLNFCAFQAYQMYALVCNAGIRTRAGRRQSVLVELKRGLSRRAARVALGSDDGVDEAARIAESVMDRLATERERRSGFEMALVLADVVLGNDNILLGSFLLARLVPDAEVESNLAALLSRSLVLESSDLRPEDYVM